MKQLFTILLATFFSSIPFLVLSQNGIVPGKIILKVMEAQEEMFSDKLNNNQVFESLQLLSIKRKYPNISKPELGQTDKHGNSFIDLTRTYILEVPEETNLTVAIDNLKESGLFEWIEPTTYSNSFYIPNDPTSAALDHLDHANVYPAWDTTQGDTNVVIGITDTSFDLLHEDLQVNTKLNYLDPLNGNDDDNDGYTDNYSGWDIWGDDNNVFFTNDWHGTGVLAVAGASTDNALGVAGVGFNCKYLPVKIANDATNGNTTIVTSDGHDAIVYCADRDCGVINCSWGTLTFSNDGQDAVNYATINKDAVVVAAAGNTNAEEFRYPASFHRAVSVTGIHNSDEFDNGTNPPFTRSDSVDVSAQGFNVMTTATVGASGGNEVYQTTGGTSIAAPIVSGVVALIRSAFPCISAQEASDLLIDHAVDIDGFSTNFMYAGKIGKRVNAYASLQSNPCLNVGINEVDSESYLVDVYPNPSRDATIFRTNIRSEWSLQVFDSEGRLLLTQSVKGNAVTVDGLDTGFYVAKIAGDKVVITKQFVIK
jgi:subtilisin family serine protease